MSAERFAATTAARLLRSANKLKGRSAEEIRVRTRQAATAWLERHFDSSSTREPDARAFWSALDESVRESVEIGNDAQLLDRFRTSRNAFFRGFDDRDATVRALRATWPEAQREIVSRADEIRNGVFKLLGYDRLDFGSPIDWHRDPVADRRAPRVHWSRVSYLDSSVVGDHKVIWELNRHQYFLTLGRAYWLTNDERYAEVIAGHLSAWMDANPPKIGINWASSLEVSFRSMSWIWALHFLKQSPSLTPQLYRRTLANLDRHARHIEDYLSTYFSPNTHLTGEALGLFVLGSCLPDLAAAPRWRELGQTILDEQLPRQVRADGVYVEQSPYYQRYTVDFYLHAKILAGRDASDQRASDDALQAALDHLASLMRPDGTVPLIGDDDGGRLLAFGDSLGEDCRGVFSTAATVFGRADYKWLAGSSAEETLWLLGPEGLSAFERIAAAPPARASCAFPAGGFYVMRDGWNRDASVAVIDAGPHGFLNGGHAHADALSFDLTIQGRPVFVDPGTFSYVQRAERDRYRGTAAHNCVTVDGQSSSAVGDGPFLWDSMARAETIQWIPCAGFDLFVGRHDGFQRLAPPARYERTVLYLKNRYWIVRDRITSDGAHTATVRFHCAPDLQATNKTLSTVELHRLSNSDASSTTLACFSANARFDVVDDFVSPAYGKRVPAITCELNVDAARSHDIVSFIAPGVRAVEHMLEPNRSKRHFRISGDGFVDTFAFDGIAGDIESDAQGVWVRRGAGSSRPESLVAFGLTTLTIDGETIVSSATPIEFVEAEMIDGRWCSIDGTPLADVGSGSGGRRLSGVGRRSSHVLLRSKD